MPSPTIVPRPQHVSVFYLPPPRVQPLHGIANNIGLNPNFLLAGNPLQNALQTVSQDGP